MKEKFALFMGALALIGAGQNSALAGAAEEAADPAEKVLDASKAPKAPTASEEAMSKDQDLLKGWQSECQSRPMRNFVSQLMTLGKGAIKTSNVKYEFKGSKVDRVTTLFAGDNCQNALYEFRETGDFQVEDNVTTADGGKGINFNFKNESLKILSAEGQELANEMRLCARNDWKDHGDEVDVTNHAREFFCSFVDVPRMSANVYKLDKDKKLLFLGGSATVDRPNDQRPTSIDQDEKYSAVESAVE
ncbi:MAG: hypothetical protein C5B49_03655 [Bdellovibrio sp.]|nr:MAG: hypothetical protein C5B49_03655 [Bdellovibrio sp.]